MFLTKFARRTSIQFFHLKKFTFQTNFLNYCNNTKEEMPKTALVILAPGAEEMEFTISVNVLRRASVSVCVAGLNGSGSVKGSRDINILPDTSLQSALKSDYDAIVLPGGLEAAKAMASSSMVGEILKKYEKEKRIIAVMCASPIALLCHEICLGKRLTSYPAFKEELSTKFEYVDCEKVVQDDILITSRGPATAFDFALKIAEVLAGKEKVCEICKAMLFE